MTAGVEIARPLSERMQHDLTVTMPPEPIFLDADAVRVAQVIGNLLNNACKFSEKDARIYLSIERAGDQAVIRVRDNGIGIEPEKIPLIFDMFMQTTSRPRLLSAGWVSAWRW